MIDDRSVSVCVPTHNPDLAHLEALLTSVAAQAFGPVEVVVSDDASTNQLALENFVKNSPISVNWSVSDERLGMVRNWNRAVGLATGKYVLVPGQDDVLDECCVEYLWAMAEDHDLSLVVGLENYLTGDGKARANPRRSVSASAVFPLCDLLLAPVELLSLGLVYGNIMADPCAALIRRDVFERLGGFSEEFDHAADLELWLRVAAAGFTVGRCKQTVALRRIHESNATRNHVTSGLTHSDRLKLHQRFGTQVADPYVWNRSVARLYSHMFYDLVCGNGKSGVSELNKIGFRGDVGTRFRAFMDEVLENFSLGQPYGRKLLSGSH